MSTDIAAAVAPPSAPPAGGEWHRRLRRFRRNRLAVGGAVFAFILVVFAIIAPWASPYSAYTPDYEDLFAAPFTNGHLLGTDGLGRDVLTRMLYGLRTALTVAFAAELGALVLALAIGLSAGYLGGRIDQLLMAGTDVMYAFPSYLFAVILLTVMGRSEVAVIIAIAVGSWVNQARLVRAQVLRIKQNEYVEAGRAMGAPPRTLVLRYILPAAWGPMLVATSFGIPAAILTEAGLSLLGLGVAPPTPSWGTMIVDGYNQILAYPYLIIPPVVLFALTMLAFTWMGDGIRDAFDVADD